MKLFRETTKPRVADSLAAFLPGGRVFQAKGEDGTNLRKYILGLAAELFRIEEEMNLISEDHDINLTVEFIEQWESAVGIPDECFLATGTLQERRRAVLAKFAKLNITTEQDFIDLAAFFGVTITIRKGGDYGVFPLEFPIEFFPTAKKARFTMLIVFPKVQEVFPLPFPINFSSGINGLLQCLFKKVRPANVDILYRYV